MLVYEKCDLYIIKLSDIKTNADLEAIFKDEMVPISSHIPAIVTSHYMRPYNKRIIVIEDIDADIKFIEDRQTNSIKQGASQERNNKIRKQVYKYA